MGGKPVLVFVVVAGDAKLFNDEKFGVGKPNGGNVPNDGIEGKPNGRPQGRSREYMIIYKKTTLLVKKKETILLKVEARSSCCFFVIVSLLLLLMVVVIADQKMNMKCTYNTHDHRE